MTVLDKQPAKQILDELAGYAGRGCAFGNDALGDFTVELATEQQQRWLKSWVLPLVEELRRREQRKLEKAQAARDRRRRKMMPR